jgi:N-methylhydantoinase A
MESPRRTRSPRLRLAADIGGTFTDVAAFDERTGKLSFGKALSTPHHLVEGITAGVEKAGTDYAAAGLFLHGSTIAINTILERTGARTALVIYRRLPRHLRDRPHQPAGCLQPVLSQA